MVFGVLDQWKRGARRWRAGVACGIVLAALGGCAAAPVDDATSPTAVDDERPVVLTTFTVLADIARNVAGDRVRVESITKIGAEIHGYEPTPGDLRRAAEAHLILDNGLGLEAWFERFVADLDVPHVVLSEGVEPIPITPFAHSSADDGAPRTSPEGAPADEGTGSAADGAPSSSPDGSPDADGFPSNTPADDGAPSPAHDDVALNPHAWMSPTAGARYARNVAEALAELDPEGADLFRANAEAYATKLEALADHLATAVATVPPERRVLVTCEGAFSYLARDAGLTEAYIWPVNAERQATPRRVARVIDLVREREVPAVFCESTVSAQPMERVAESTDARLAGTLYVDSLSEPDGPVPTYLDLLRHDIDVVVAGLTEGTAP